MADERRCICCGEVTDPARLEVRDDPGKPGTWRVVEVRGVREAPYVRTHRRGICCQEHAAIIAGLICVNVATDAIRATIARARCEA